MTKKKNICYVTISPMRHERRNLNQMKLLEEMGFNGVLLALWEEGLPETEKIYSTKIIRLKIKHPDGGKLKFLEFNYRVHQKLKELSFDLIHVHELWPLPGCIPAIKRRKIPAIYDAHEFFMGIEIFNTKKKEKWIWYLAEKYFTPYMDALITVSEPHRRIYTITYKHFLHKNSMVIYNVPEKTEIEKIAADKASDLPERFIIFQGLFRPGRGIIPMVKSMQYIDDGTVLLMYGYGELERDIKNTITKYGLEKRVIIKGKYNPDDILKTTVHALAGITLFEPTSINYRYAMPNKFFEYIQAEIPLITSDLATFRAILNHYKIGETVKNLTPESIAGAIHQIIYSPTAMAEYKKNLKIAKEIFNWNMEKAKLAGLYEKLLQTKK